MLIIFRYILITCALFLLPQATYPADSEWHKAKKEFISECRNNNDETRISVTANLAANITPQTESESVLLLTNQISNELSRSKKGKAEELVNIKVIDACIDGLRRIQEDKAVKRLIDSCLKQSDEWRARFYAIKALGSINKPEVIKGLIVLSKEKKTPIQVAAFRALGQLKTPEAMNSAAELMKSKADWQIKLAALDYFRIMESPESIQYLKQILKDRDKLEPRVLSDLIKILEIMTTKMPTDPNEAPLSTKSVILGEYYGIPIESSNIVFLMDTSGSMEAPVKEIQITPDTQPKEKVVISGTGGKKPRDEKKAVVPPNLENKKEAIDKKPVKTRLDAVKKELINAIYNLDESVNFSIIFYSSAVRPWKIKTIPATFDNKFSAIEAIERQTHQGSTSTYDALEYAYKIMVGNSTKKPDSALEEVDGADTFFLLTDGYPTSGKIIQTPDIVDAIRKINEIRQVKINTIAVGSPGVNNPDQPSFEINTEFLKQLADATGGSFVDKTK